MTGIIRSVFGGKDRPKEHDEIEDGLKKDKRSAKAMIEILMLGAGGSGKSTVVKHMLEQNHPRGSILYDSRKSECIVNVCTDIHIVCEANISDRMGAEGEKYALSDESIAGLVNEIGGDKTFSSLDGLDIDTAKKIELIWAEPGIKRSFEKRSKTWIMDNTAYFFDHILELAHPDWQPSFKEFILARNQTLGIVTYEFKVGTVRSEDGDAGSTSATSSSSSGSGGRSWRIRITDVGGQHSERRKWMKVFTEVNVVLFVFSLASYDCKLWEDHSKSAFEDGFSAFKLCCSNSNFEKTDFIVFLNKDDLFKEKIKTIPFSVYCAEAAFAGDNGHNEDLVVEYTTTKLQSMFAEPTASRSGASATETRAAAFDTAGGVIKRRNIFFHRTCATNVEFMAVLLPQIQLGMIQREMRHAALI